MEKMEIIWTRQAKESLKFITKISFCFLCSFMLFLVTDCSAQKHIQLFFGDGFLEDTCTVLFQQDRAEYDTIFQSRVLSTKMSLGYADGVKIRCPKKNKGGSILVIINGRRQNRLSFDKLRNGTQILIDFNRNIIQRYESLGNEWVWPEGHPKGDQIDFQSLDYFIRQNGGFEFY